MNTVFFLVVAVVVVTVVLRLLRNQKLREKYAALWLVVGIVTIGLAAFPQLLVVAAESLGFEVPANLLFMLAILLLLAVALHLSLEISRLEDETRILAEESAILRSEIAEFRGSLPPTVPGAE